MIKEESFKDFVVNNREQIDPNTQVLAIGGDVDGLRMDANQIHFKSIKGENKNKYDDALGARSYVEVLLGSESKVEYVINKDNEKSEWKLVTKRKSRNVGSRLNSTIFVARILLLTKEK